MKLYFVVGIFPEYLLTSCKILGFQGTHPRKCWVGKRPLYHFSASPQLTVTGMRLDCPEYWSTPPDVWVDDPTPACMRATSWESDLENVEFGATCQNSRTEQTLLSPLFCSAMLCFRSQWKGRYAVPLNNLLISNNQSPSMKKGFKIYEQNPL